MHSTLQCSSSLVADRKSEQEKRDRQRASMPQCYWFILISCSLNRVSLQHKYIILCMIFHFSLNDSYSPGFTEEWLLQLGWQSSANVTHIGLRGGCHKRAMSGVIKKERKTGQWKSMEERWNSPPLRGRQKSVEGVWSSQALWTKRETEVKLCKHSGCPKHGPSLTFLKNDPSSLGFTSALNQTRWWGNVGPVESSFNLQKGEKKGNSVWQDEYEEASSFSLCPLCQSWRSGACQDFLCDSLWQIHKCSRFSQVARFVWIVISWFNQCCWHYSRSGLEVQLPQTAHCPTGL